MKKLFIILMFFSVQLYAAEERERNLVPLGCSQITDISTALELPDIPSGAAYAIWQATGAAFRWKDDGVVPTSQIGLEQTSGSQYKYFYEGVLGKVQVIEISTDTVLDICYYK